MSSKRGQVLSVGKDTGTVLPSSNWNSSSAVRPSSERLAATEFTKLIVILPPHQSRSPSRSRSNRDTLGRLRFRNCFIGEALALAAHDGARGALLVGDAERLAS